MNGFPAKSYRKCKVVFRKKRATNLRKTEQNGKEFFKKIDFVVKMLKITWVQGQYPVFRENVVPCKIVFFFFSVSNSFLMEKIFKVTKFLFRAKICSV